MFTIRSISKRGTFRNTGAKWIRAKYRHKVRNKGKSSTRSHIVLNLIIYYTINSTMYITVLCGTQYCSMQGSVLCIVVGATRYVPVSVGCQMKKDHINSTMYIKVLCGTQYRAVQGSMLCMVIGATKYRLKKYQNPM